LSALSPRYSGAAAGLLLLFVVPLTFSLFSPRRAENCRDPEALRATSQIRGSEPLGENLKARSADVVQWSEGIIRTAPGRGELRFQIVRSHDWRTHALNVLDLVEGKIEGESQQLIHAGPEGERIPVHVVLDHTQSRIRLVAYSFMDGAEVVERPFLHELEQSFNHLLTGSTPITVLVVSGSSDRRGVAEMQARATAWIVDASHYVEASCGTFQ